MHILVIFTGGTIGSASKEGTLSPVATQKQQLIEEFFAIDKDTNVRFSTLSPYEILSENLSAKHLNALIDCIEGVDETAYDGIVVTHGTDTLQYTAAALDFCLTKHLPVLLVSAAYPLEDKRSNALSNFRAAVRFIQSKPQKGVYVSYQNQGSNEVAIHLASRLLSHAECSANLYSFGPSFASVNNENGVILPHHSQFQPAHGVGKVHFCENPSILSLEVQPEKVYPLDMENYRAVLLSPYHSGTLNTAGKAFQEFCLTAKKAGVPVFLSGGLQGGSYESKKAFDDLGIVPIQTTKIALYTKCWLALSLQKKCAEEIREFLLTPLANEFLD